MKNKKIILILIVLLLISGCSKKYTVTIVNSNGELLDTITISKGDNLSNVDKPEKDGYIFVSWMKDGIKYDENTPIYDDITIEPKWVLVPQIYNNYTISFDFGDETIKTQTVKEGDKIDKPSDPVKENYQFIGWYYNDKLYDFDLEVHSDMTLVAKYEIKNVTVSFDLDGGSGIKKIEIDCGTPLENIENPTKFGYHFVSWYHDEEPFDISQSIYEDIELVAKWEAIEYVRVSFDTDGGNTIKSKMIEKNTKLDKIEIPVKEGYTFKYWLLDNDIFDNDIIITKNITLKAVYEKNY